MKRKTLLSAATAILMASSMHAQSDVNLESGAYSPNWESVKQWECPEWFKDAKFGIWAHWGPQCQAEDGDWYARFMYYEGTGQNQWHLQHFGEPDVFGLKDLCNAWKADQWDPDALVKLYKSVGARYFFTLGQHHDNFDLWNSPYQEWNSVNVGPRRDIVKEWSDACEKYDLPLGVSMHGSHTWTWMEKSQDYDGNLTKEDGLLKNADGTDKWWKGLDPQELYAQRHEHSTGWQESGTIHSQWDWGAGASLPSAAFKKKFQNRVLECINDYNPKMLYFDDTVLPFYGCDEEVGLNILSHYYNHSANANGGKPDVVVMGKQLNDGQKESLLWDVERGIPDNVQDKYWQTCTCIGSWHYDQNVYNNNSYKSAQQVIDMLVDIVSKNGNLLLSVPIKGNGTIDDKEKAILENVGEWMNVNSQSIYGTRPWKVCGEGPLVEASNPLNNQGFNENNNYTNDDVRFVQKKDTIYATIMRNISGRYVLESFGILSPYYSGNVTSVTLLGHGAVTFSNDIDGLVVSLPEINSLAPVLAITVDGDEANVNFETIIEYYEKKVAEIVAIAGYNTGQYSREKVDAFGDQVKEAKQLASADEAAQKVALNSLKKAYAELLNNGYNVGGSFDDTFKDDLTTEYLVEGNNFSRSDGGSTRFGSPENWTVENFTIPNGSDGVKNGIDKYSGQNSLMLGVWDDINNSTDGDLSNARIYRKVHLEAGRYYFGASYNTSYNLNDKGYIFASSSLLPTSEIPLKSIASYAINKQVGNGTFSGIYFTLDQGQDVYLGFQVNLLNGSTQQEFRADNVKLLYYGEMDRAKLDDLILTVDAIVYDTPISNNTGFYSKDAIKALEETMNEADALGSNASYEEILTAYNKLSEAYNDFLTNKRNPGGLADKLNAQDVTTDYLVEGNNFSRLDPSITTRFATPANWTVENYRIPNGSDGVKNGLDKNPGYDCLTLGLWNDRDNNEEGNLSNARVYRTVHLKAGRYYFGAAYNTTYNINEKSYIFAAENLLNTGDIPTQSIAFYPINKASESDDEYGINFTILEDQDVVLGFQSNLNNGSPTQEFRAKSVKLYYYGEITLEKINQLVEAIEDSLQYCTINENTGYFSQEAYDQLMLTVDKATKLSSSASFIEIESMYNQLNIAFQEFLTNGKNKGGIPDDFYTEDITEKVLKESHNFARTEESGTTRFGSPQNWTVENILIDKGEEGMKNGLDKYPGNDCLMLGIWDDRDNNQEGDIADARIYQTIHLEAGRYFFGGQFNTLYNMSYAYFYVANENVPSADMESNSIAYYNFKDANVDKNFYGLYFTLDKAQDVNIGIQANLSVGANAQEFRVSNIKLLQEGVDSIEEITDNLHSNAPESIYSLTGIRLKQAPSSGLYIYKKGNTSKVMLAK